MTEGVATCHVVVELIEARACWRQQHGVARLGVSSGGVNGSTHVIGKVCPQFVAKRALNLRRVGTNEHRVAQLVLQGFRQFGEVTALAVTAGNQYQWPFDRPDRRNRRRNVGSFRVVYLIDAINVRNEMH